MLELKNISKCYGQKEIFKDFNLTVEEGKILSLEIYIHKADPKLNICVYASACT